MTKRKSPYIEARTPNYLQKNSERELYILPSRNAIGPEEYIHFHDSKVTFNFSGTAEDESLSVISMTLSDRQVVVEEKKGYRSIEEAGSHIVHEWEIGENGKPVRYTQSDKKSMSKPSVTTQPDEVEDTFRNFQFAGVELISSKIDTEALQKYNYHKISTNVYSDRIGETKRYLFGKMQERFLQQLHQQDTQPVSHIWDLFKKYHPEDVVVLRPVKKKPDQPKA